MPQLALQLALAAAGPAAPPPAPPPLNVVLVVADDLGYGDLGIYGNPTIRTPRLDRMAVEGQKWTSFYVAESVCTPSRAALLTGRLPIRNGMNAADNLRRVLFPDSTGGLPAGEVTLAELLKRRGYATSMIGKWHLGHLPQHLPRAHGFDHYFGIPYSNDMDMIPIEGASIGGEDPRKRRRIMEPRPEYWNVPLIRDETVAERPADQRTITRRYTEEAVRFIRENASRPFFLYFAHAMPHVPLFASPPFAGRSPRGVYGDVVEEIDWSVGEVLDTVAGLGLDRRTIVIFISDNGPWALFDHQSGSTGPLSGSKGGTYEGGMRVPAIFRAPGIVMPAVVTDVGHDLGAVLREGARSPRQDVFFYRGARLYAVRHGAFKAHFFTRGEYDDSPEVAHDPPLLFNVDEDPGERFNIAATVEPVENQIAKYPRPGS